MRTLCIDTGNEQADTVRPLSVLLCVCLCAVCDARNDLGQRNGAVVGEAGGERLLLHEVGEDAGIGGETGKGDTEVRVDGNDLLLVGRELFCVALGMVSELYRASNPG